MDTFLSYTMEEPKPDDDCSITCINTGSVTNVDNVSNLSPVGEASTTDNSYNLMYTGNGGNVGEVSNLSPLREEPNTDSNCIHI